MAGLFGTREQCQHGQNIVFWSGVGPPTGCPDCDRESSFVLACAWAEAVIRLANCLSDTSGRYISIETAERHLLYVLGLGELVRDPWTGGAGA